MISLISGKGGNGTTTSAVAVAATWPVNVILVDADPHGGDIATGWCCQRLLRGEVRTNVGLLSFAAATRHADTIDRDTLNEHLQTLLDPPQVRLLTGLPSAAHLDAVGEAGWRRLAEALAALTEPVDDDGAPDVIVDCGRYGPATPWPVLWASDLVLVAVRPKPRQVFAARAVVEALAPQIPAQQLGLLICATTPEEARDTVRALGLPSAAQLPVDPLAAAIFTDGVDWSRRARRLPLVREARTAAARLHRTVPRVTSLVGGR